MKFANAAVRNSPRISNIVSNILSFGGIFNTRNMLLTNVRNTLEIISNLTFFIDFLIFGDTGCEVSTFNL